MIPCHCLTLSEAMTTHHGEPTTRTGSVWTATSDLPVCPALSGRKAEMKTRAPSEAPALYVHIASS